MDIADLVRPLAAGLDWNALRFPGEGVLRQQVDARPELAEDARQWCDPTTAPAGVAPTGLIGGGLRAATVAPAFARLAALLRETLALDVAPEITVFSAGRWFVECLPAEPGAPLRIAVSSAVASSVGVREALFVVGRRIARRLFEQYAFLANPTAGKTGLPKDRLLLRGLWKFQELTSDRLGLLCAQDVDLCCRAVLKSIGGLADDLVLVDWEALLAHRAAEEEAMIGDGDHEFALLRIAALRQFAANPKYQACFAAPALVATIPTPAPPTIASAPPPPVVAETPPLAAKIEPAMIVEPPPPAPTVLITPVATPTPPVERIEEPTVVDVELEEVRKRFTLWAALWVLGVREALQEEVRSELWEMFGSAAVAALDEIEQDDGDERCARQCARMAPRLARAPLDSRIAVIEDLVHLALTDARLSPRERERLNDLADLLDLSNEDVASVVAEFADPDFARHRFSVGEEVEVKFDDEWAAGEVIQVETGGDLRVRFFGVGQVYWINPTADLVRPRAKAAKPAKPAESAV